MNTDQSAGQVLLQTLLNAFSEGAGAAIVLFQDDAVIEFPYAASAGAPERRKMDKNAYYAHLEAGLKHMPGLKFSDLRVYPLARPGGYWAEVHGEGLIPSTGNTYHQDYVIHFTLQSGKFSTYKEYWDPVASLKAFGGAGGTQEMFNVQA